MDKALIDKVHRTNGQHIPGGGKLFELDKKVSKPKVQCSGIWGIATGREGMRDDRGGVECEYERRTRLNCRGGRLKKEKEKGGGVGGGVVGGVWVGAIKAMVGVSGYGVTDDGHKGKKWGGSH